MKNTSTASNVSATTTVVNPAPAEPKLEYFLVEMVDPEERQLIQIRVLAHNSTEAMHLARKELGLC